MAATTGAPLVWRASATFTLPILERYADGSYQRELRWNPQCASRDRTPQSVRVVDYTASGGATHTTRYRFVTSILEPVRAPADKLAALYHERWDMEAAFDERKTHLRTASSPTHDPTSHHDPRHRPAPTPGARVWGPRFSLEGIGVKGCVS